MILYHKTFRQPRTLIFSFSDSLFKKIKKTFLELFFPRTCLGCGHEGSWLCLDCKAVIDVSRFHQKSPDAQLDDLYFAAEYKSPLLKNLVTKFKYEPLVKELAQPLSSLICDHFQLLEVPPAFFSKQIDFVLVPIPLEKRRLRWRGFNQAEEIAGELAKFLNLPLLNNVLIKKQATLSQAELTAEERKQNPLRVFSCRNKQQIRQKSILLVDDIYTTGSTMKEAARLLKKSGAKKVIGITIARATPEQDIV